MPSVRMLTTSAGPNGVRAKGYVYPVTVEDGEGLVRGGFAAWVEAPSRAAPEPAVETAAIEPAGERAVRPSARKRKGA